MNGSSHRPVVSVPPVAEDTAQLQQQQPALDRREAVVTAAALFHQLAILRPSRSTLPPTRATWLRPIPLQFHVTHHVTFLSDDSQFLYSLMLKNKQTAVP